VNRCTWPFAILVLLRFAAVTTAGQESIHRHAGNDNAEPAWPALMDSMSKMDAAMASVGPSGNGDADFVSLMLPHHQAAIDMAKTQLLYGKDPQMRRLAQEIVTEQQSEIELMQLWLKRHGPELPKTAQKPASSRPKEN
jgi:uncharacterized protein (DUF305 family)